jgi:hypothetical protein
MRGVLTVVFAGLMACHSPEPQIAAPPAEPTSSQSRRVAATSACHYDVVFEAPSRLSIDARCDGSQVRGFLAAETSMAHHVAMVAADGSPIEQRDAKFALPAGARAAVHYELDLDAVAREHQDIDVVYASEDAWLTAVSTWLLRPYPINRKAEAIIDVQLPPGVEFASGLTRRPDGRRSMPAWTIPVATYAAFGRLTRVTHTLPGPLANDGSGHPLAQIEMVTLPGRFAITARDRQHWLERTVAAVSDFWHGFPVAAATLFVVPYPGGREIAQGKVVATGGASVAIVLGSKANRSVLEHDWVLVHELFHLGVPSFAGEGKWLDEGLATYYEPLIRTRAGWRSERALWGELASGLPRGLQAMEIDGLENARDGSGIYWGGAMLALLADVQARRRSDGRLGLEDGLRAVLAKGGNATTVWSVDDIVQAVDERLGEPVLRPLVQAHRESGQPANLDGTLRELGVGWGPRGPWLDDAATLQHIRRAIVRPTVDPPASR